jgi:hypothetical protein
MKQFCFCPILTKIELCQQISVKPLNIKFHENICNGSQVVTHKQIGGHGKHARSGDNGHREVPTVHGSITDND